jgi:predicted TIM-barrel fold metal-dependent hydrolase
MQIGYFDVNTLFGVWPKRPADIALPTLLQRLRDHHITRACTLSAAGIFYDFVEGNAETLAAAAAHPELVPIGTVNPCRWLGCLDEARRLIDQGVKLFRFFPQYQEWHISQAPFRKLLRTVLAPAGVTLVLPAELGFTTIGDMATDLPNAIIVESFKYAFLSEAIVVMQERPNVYVETHMINSPNWVELLKAEVGVERLIFGSNAPLAYVSAAVAQVEYAPISEAEKSLIFGGNLQRVLGLPAAA